MGGDPGATLEVPAAVIVLGAGSIGAAGGLELGHFAAMRWNDPDQAAAQGAGVNLGSPGEGYDSSVR